MKIERLYIILKCLYSLDNCLWDTGAHLCSITADLVTMLDQTFLELEVHEKHRRASDSLRSKRTSRYHLVSVGKGFSFYHLSGVLYDTNIIAVCGITGGVRRQPQVPIPTTLFRTLNLHFSSTNGLFISSFELFAHHQHRCLRHHRLRRLSAVDEDVPKSLPTIHYKYCRGNHSTPNLHCEWCGLLHILMW